MCFGVGRWIHSEGGPSQGRLVKPGVSQNFLRRSGGLRRGSEAEAMAGWRSWWKLLPFPSFKLWSGSRNNPVLHRERGGHPCRQRQVFCRALIPVHRQSDGHSSCSCETVPTGCKLRRKLEIFAVDVPVNMQLFQQFNSFLNVKLPLIQFIDRVLDVPGVPQRCTHSANCAENREIPQVQRSVTWLLALSRSSWRR